MPTSATTPKSDTKNVPITQEDKTYRIIDKPSKEEQDVIQAVFQKFRLSANHRNGSFANFDGLGLIDYINESVRRFITNVDAREDIEDWQARVHDPFTRNKTLGFLSKLVQVLPIAEFTPRGDDDYRKAQILSNLYEYSEDVDDYEELLINILLECITKGTAIGYEGHEKTNKAIREVQGSGDDLTVTDGMKKTNKLYGSLVPLEDFYPQNVGIRTIKKMVYCFWRSQYPYQQFMQDFAMYDRVNQVQPRSGTLFADGENRPYYIDYTSSDVKDGNVEVIRYYNKDTDEYVMIANGIWLNPLTQKGLSVVSPIPFSHKELPFWDIRFEIYTEFFYGKSLPDKLKSLQDVLNVLTNMSLDQSFLSIFPPILTAGMDSIEDDYIRPGRRTPVDTQGLPISEQYMKLDMGTPTGWHQFVLEYIRKVMGEASLDQVSSGHAGVGGRTTAQEIRTATEGIAAVLGLFARLVNYGIKRKALLRGSNILQFWTDPKTPYIDQVMGKGAAAEARKAFNTFKINNTILSDGKRGNKIIEMYQNKTDLPTRTQVKTRAALSGMENNKRIEVMAITGEHLRNLEFDIKLGVNQRQESTQDIRKALQLEKTRIYMSFFPDLVDREELAAELAEVMGDDPTKVLKPEVLNPPPPQQGQPQPGQPGQPGEQAANAEQAQQSPMQPQQSVSLNSVNGVLNGAGSGGSDISALQKMITGH